MSKKDDIKEQIGMFKFWLGILVGSVLAMVGWAVTNFETAKVWLLLASLITSIFCLVLIMLIVGKINKRIKKLRKM